MLDYMEKYQQESAVWNELQKRITESLRPALELEKEISKTFKSVGLDETIRRADIIGKNVNKLECTEDKISESLITFYKENWGKVCARIQKRLNEVGADELTLSTFQEAFTAHKAGLYRSVCRLLFPEIERLARGIFPSENTLKVITSLKEIRNYAGELSTFDIRPEGYFSVVLYKRLDDHFYEYINDQRAESFKRISTSKIPNRHAAMHGLVDYNTPQHSLNMIFLADYLVQVILTIQKKGLIASDK